MEIKEKSLSVTREIFENNSRSFRHLKQFALFNDNISDNYDSNIMRK